MPMNSASQDQDVAAALSMARQVKNADGNNASDDTIHIGPIKAVVAGRTDHLPMHVPSGAYVVPADIVSAIGEGNTDQGFAILEAMIEKRMQGDDVPEGEPVPIVAAGGEYVIPPLAVRNFGGGNIDLGHKLLDEWVKFERSKTIQTLKKLPGPKKD